MSQNPYDARNVEFLSKQVRNLKRQHQAHDPGAIQLLQSTCPTLSGLPPDEIADLDLHHYEYQAVVAQQFGFTSWSQMVAYAQGRPRRVDGRIVISENRHDELLDALNDRASLHGMPPIGTRLANKYGLESVVVDYDFFPTPTTFARYPNDCDYLPIIAPLNISQRLTDFINETDRCTSKRIVFLDTMPDVHPFKLGSDIHCCNFSGNPEESYVYVDFTRAHETTFAHELAHLWFIYVEGGDCARVFRDRSDKGKVNQLDFLQSFVLDLRVNDLIEQRGFDMSLIMDDKINAITMVRDALALGYKPSSAREALISSLSIAGAYLEQKRWPQEMKDRLKTLLETIETMKPGWHQTAMKFVEIIERNGYDSKDAVRASMNEIIKLGFATTSEIVDFEQDVLEPPLNECMQDKNPKQFEGLPVPLKLEIGKALARAGISGDGKVNLSASTFGSAQIVVECRDGKTVGPLHVNYQLIPFHIVDEQMRRNQQRRIASDAVRMLTGQTSAGVQNPYGRKIMPGMVPDDYGRLPGDPGYNTCFPPGQTPQEQMAAMQNPRGTASNAPIPGQPWSGPHNAHPQFPQFGPSGPPNSPFEYPQPGFDPNDIHVHNPIPPKPPFAGGFRRQNMAGVGLAVAREQLRRAQMQAGIINLYNYAGNNPTNFIDPSGSAPIRPNHAATPPASGVSALASDPTGLLGLASDDLSNPSPMPIQPTRPFPPPSPTPTPCPVDSLSASACNDACHQAMKYNDVLCTNFCTAVAGHTCDWLFAYCGRIPGNNTKQMCLTVYLTLCSGE
jgi:hypothetical protein